MVQKKMEGYLTAETRIPVAMREHETRGSVHLMYVARILGTDVYRKRAELGKRISRRHIRRGWQSDILLCHPLSCPG